jgi:hypothetical protein
MRNALDTELNNAAAPWVRSSDESLINMRPAGSAFRMRLRSLPNDGQTGENRIGEVLPTIRQESRIP